MVLVPILEKYGIVLVPAVKIEYPHILIDLPGENAILIIFEDQDQGKVEREISLEIFIEHLEKALKKYREELSRKKYTMETITTTP